ncbi:MAG: adenylosuccinate lyase [Anaerolineae bacterium]|nr:adenylosuccinate lyase [Anaerolineae bacterium]
MAQEGFASYLSPFSWRYGSEEMRRIWSEVHKRELWRRVWVALAQAQAQAGLVSEAQLVELRAHQDDVDVEAALAVEREIGHDLMAELKVYAGQCPTAGGVLHLGATSADIEDNADVLRLREALQLLAARLEELLRVLADRIEAEADTPAMAYTHLQPAEPTTLGYRLCQVAQDVLESLHRLREFLGALRGKGFKGAVGTYASYAELLEGIPLSPLEMERLAMEALGLEAFPVATQTYPRLQDYRALTLLAELAAALHKFALDLRILQSPVHGEMAEPFGKQQVGSSAMPFKRNPVTAEGLCSLARWVSSLPQVAWDNAALSALERTLDDSANRRIILAEACLATDEIVRRATRILRGLRVDREAARQGVERWAAFAATERVLMALGKAGGDRQQGHEVIRRHSMAAWEALRRGEPNPLPDLLAADPYIRQFLPEEAVRSLMAEGTSPGLAAARSREFAAHLRQALSQG